MGTNVMAGRNIRLVLCSALMRAGSFTFSLGIGVTRGMSGIGRLTPRRGIGCVFFGNSKGFPMGMNAHTKRGLNRVCTASLCGHGRGNSVVMGRGKLPVAIAGRSRCIGGPVNGVRPGLAVSMSPAFACGKVALSTLFSVGFNNSVFSCSRVLTAKGNLTGHALGHNRRGGCVVMFPNIARSNRIGAGRISTSRCCNTLRTRSFVCSTSFVGLGRLSVNCSFPSSVLGGAPIGSLGISFITHGLYCLVGRAPNADPRNNCSAAVFSRTVSCTSLPFAHAFNVSVGLNFWLVGEGG